MVTTRDTRDMTVRELLWETRLSGADISSSVLVDKPFSEGGQGYVIVVVPLPAYERDIMNYFLAVLQQLIDAHAISFDPQELPDPSCQEGP